jgi:hypothetical protein
VVHNNVGRWVNTVKIKSHTLRTIKEEFDEYELEDGNILRVKQALITFAFADDSKVVEKGKKIVNTILQAKLVAGIVPTGEVDTTNLVENLVEPLRKEDRVKEVGFKPIRTHLNIYETDEVLILTRNHLQKVWLTKSKDNAGIPRYWVEATISARVEGKETPTSLPNLG